MPSLDEEVLSELREIRKLLTPPPPAPAPKGMAQEFKAFLSQYKVLGLAVAFILGVYLGGLVQALVKDLLLPTIGLAVPGLNNLSTYAARFMNQTFYLGDFLAAFITFIIVAVVVFLIVKLASRYKIQ